jgi:BlaI family transcriptional regulator, penicillinase repressor
MRNGIAACCPSNHATVASFRATNLLVDNPIWHTSKVTGRYSRKEDGDLPPRKSPTLTEAELRLMEVLWQKGPATVQQVLEVLPEKEPLAYNSVLTTIRILEKKGYVKHVKDGRAFVYSPLVERKDATRSEISRLVNRFFGNSHELLVLNILEDQGMNAAELKRLRTMLEGSK